MKEILNLKPIIQKQMTICDPDMLLKCLKQLHGEISLQLLSKNLVILSSKLSGQRDQTLKALNVEHMVLQVSKSTFHQRIIKNYEKKFSSTANRI